ncbi:hypothetical protein BH11PSE11_BH11PSE11_18680 [soil metagenome]
MFRRLGLMIASPLTLTRGSAHWLWAMQHRERVRLLGEMSQMRGLLPLLMKQRNGYRWDSADRREMREHLKRLGSISPYVVLFVAPGGLLALPLLAWWLDRRRLKRAANKDGPVAQ